MLRNVETDRRNFMEAWTTTKLLACRRNRDGPILLGDKARHPRRDAQTWRTSSTQNNRVDAFTIKS